MPNILRGKFSAAWFPDADAENAPPGVLLRGDNLLLDEVGALSLRQGSAKIDTALPGGAAHSLGTFMVRGVKHRFVVAGTRLYDNGVDTGIDFDGSGDAAFGTDNYQVFAARGKTKKKYDGTTRNNWGIAAPSQAPVLTAANATTLTIATFDGAGEPGAVNFVVTEGTSAIEAGWDGTVNGATRLTPLATTGRASAYKKWTTDQDFLNVAGTIGGDTDLFDGYVALSDPSNVDTITYMFGLSTGTDPFVDDYYSFDFDIGGRTPVSIKDAGAAAPSIYRAAVLRSITAIGPGLALTTKNPADAVRIVSTLGRLAGSSSRARVDAIQSSPSWAHLSATRAQFNRVGNTSGRGWTTVRGFKVIVKTLNGSATTVAFDSTLLYGGGRRALTGKFKCVFVFARDNGNYVELSPPSPESNEITLNQQGLNVKLPAVAMSAADPQVNQSWIFMVSDWMTAYFRVAVTGSTPSSGMTMDEFARSPHGLLNISDWYRFTQWGMTAPGATIDASVTVVINKSEVDAVSDGVLLIPGLTGPPDNIIAIEGPIARRMFALTSEGWLFVSSQDSPSHYSVFQVVDLRRFGTPYWLKRTSGGLHVGMSKDIIRIAGSGNEPIDHGPLDLYGDQVHTGNPPVDQAVYGDGSSLVYRSAEGLQALSSGATSPVNYKGTSLLWRGKTRHGVAPLNIKTGRFRISIDNHILYMLASEGASSTSTPVIWRYDTIQQQWYRTVYPVNFLSLQREPDGDLIAGDDQGNVWDLEVGTQDDVNNIPVTILSPIDSDGTPFNAKTAMDLAVGGNTGGLPLSIVPLIDGATSPPVGVAPLIPAALTADIIHRQSLSALPDFARIQLRMTGAFFRFILRYYNIAYRVHPQQVMQVDTGYLSPPGNADFGWIGRVEVGTRSPADLEVVPTFDDVVKDAIPLPVVAGKTSVYATMLKRGQNKGKRPLIIVRTTNPAGVGNIGFEPYFIRLWFKGVGNQNEKIATVTFGSVVGASRGVTEWQGIG